MSTHCKTCIAHQQQKEELKQKYESNKQNIKEFERYKYMLDKPEYIVVHCPHCNICLLIYEHEIHCGIFRCGKWRHNNEQLPQHLSKKECQNIDLDQIYGCAKPFKLEGSKAVICDYI